MARLQIGIGFHMSVPSYADGIGKYWRTLFEHGDAVLAKGVRYAGPLKEVYDLSKQYPNVPAYGIYRVDQFSWGNDVPDYNANPVDMAQVYWDEVDSRWPEELDKSWVWVEFPNEVDKNRSEWVGYLAIACAKEALKRGYKYICPGWSGGEPEKEDWQYESWYEYFRLCAQYPDRLGISLHEYTFGMNNLMVNARPYHIGRVTWMNEVVQKRGIDLPTTFITEWGYSYVSAPRQSVAILDMVSTLEWYIKNAPNVKGVAIWCLDSNSPWKELSRTINSYMVPLAKVITSKEWPEVELPDHSEKHKVVIYKVAQEHSFQHYMEIIDIAYRDYKRTVTFSTDDMLTMLAAGNEESYAVIWDDEFPSQQEAIQKCNDFGYRYEARDLVIEEVDTFPYNISLGHLFKYRYRLNSPFNAVRDYGLHEGLDYDIIGGNVDNKVSVLCTYPGVVERSVDSTGKYGKYVRIRHRIDGHDFITWYCHLDQRYVEEGAVLKAGNAIGEIGTTGNVTGEHVHFNLQVPGYGLHGYVIDDVIDPYPLMPNPATLPLYGEQVYDLLDYIRGDGRMYEVRHANGATETFQVQVVNDREFYLVKNSQYEHYYSDDVYIYRAEDTSPGPAPDYAERPGEDRWYTQYELGNTKAKWCNRMMALGETFTGPGHHVSFFYKSDCARSLANSGPAVNVVTLANHLTEFYSYGRTFALSDVIELKTNTGETMWFGKNFGLVGWENADGLKSKISEIHYNRPDLVREAGCFSNI